MTYNLYSVHDAKTGFSAPFLDSTDESAARGFSFAFAKADNLYSFAPADFRLYRIGTFDTSSGKVNSCVPVHVADGSSFVHVAPGGDFVEE